ncbi:MAG: VWA domain-containing protein [Blastocatellia bacterium]|nr:VWA domain-containing protein [Blastocatellia bacterium]
MAQSGRRPQGQPPGEKPVVRIETREVVLPLMAYDLSGKFVDDLTEKDVLVLEEGEARPVARLKREPANIVLILDLGNEIGTFKNGPTERIERQEKPIWERGGPGYQTLQHPTARTFAERFVASLSPSDQIAIIQYSDKVQLIQDWTRDKGQATAALQSKYRVGVRSTYLDALKLAADKLASRKEGRRVIVLLSDGLDSASKTPRSNAMLALEKSRAAVFVVGWAEALRSEVAFAADWAGRRERATTSSAQRIEELRRHIPQLDAAAVELRQVAEASGGEIWLPLTHTDIIKMHTQLAREIGAQYSLSFVTEHKPSLEDMRSIQVLPARPGLSVRSRRSYYAGEE